MAQLWSLKDYYLTISQIKEKMCLKGENTVDYLFNAHFLINAPIFFEGINAHCICQVIISDK